MKVEATEVDGRKVYSVRAFNQGVASWLNRLPTLWVEGELTELRRQQRWQSVFFTLKDPDDGACLSVQMPRGQFDALRLDLQNGERVHVFGRPELYEQRGELRLKALSIERFGLGAHLAALERLKQKLAAEGLFDASRKRQLPRFPQLIGLVTGNDAAAARSRICCRSPTSESCGRSRSARCRSSRRSGTSRTRRSAISLQTCARRRPLPRHASSSRTSRSSALASRSRAIACTEARTRSPADTRAGSRAHATGCTVPRSWRSSVAATTSCGARRRSSAATRSPCASPTARSERPLTDLSFEDAQKELEAIVERLERGDAGVDELTKLWERGEELYRICAAKLEAVHGRIEELARQGESESASSSPS